MAKNVATDKEDASSLLARNFASTRYADIPQEIRERVKMSILDTLGVSIAASSLAPGCRELADLAKEGAGRRESTILVFGERVPAWMAAFVNGGMAHGLDFDDVHHEGLSHPSGAVVPAAFAIAERVGATNGQDFITAIALGHDMVMRMLSSLHWDIKLLFNWLRFPVVAVFGAAATCGKLLGFNEDKIQAAIGTALCYSAGAGQLRYSNVRGLYDSWAAQGAVMAALMAEKGIAGPTHPLEGDTGFFNVYFRGEYDRNILLADLGRKFFGTYIGYKAWPSCAATQPSINATLELVQQHDLDPEDIDEIAVSVGAHTVVNCEPLEYMRKPKTILEAKFSVPFTVALAATRRRVTLTDFTQESINDTAILALTQRVATKLDAQLNASRGLDGSIVDIKTKTGKKYSQRTDCVYGHYRNPMNMEAIIAKFKDCASYSAKPLSAKNLEKTVATVLKLEEVNDAGEIIRLLS
jgi:2-methylcitrate dehydratase PrpD